MNINYLKSWYPPWQWYFLVQLRKVDPHGIKARVLKCHDFVGTLVRTLEKVARVFTPLMLQNVTPR